MSDPALLVTLASAGTAAIAITAAAGLKGWQEWLDLRRSQLGPRRLRPGGEGELDLVELRIRVRRLEAIANGGD